MAGTVAKTVGASQTFAAQRRFGKHLSVDFQEPLAGCHDGMGQTDCLREIAGGVWGCRSPGRQPLPHVRKITAELPADLGDEVLLFGRRCGQRGRGEMPLECGLQLLQSIRRPRLVRLGRLHRQHTEPPDHVLNPRRRLNRGHVLPEHPRLRFKEPVDVERGSAAHHDPQQTDEDRRGYHLSPHRSCSDHRCPAQREDSARPRHRAGLQPVLQRRRGLIPRPASVRVRHATLVPNSAPGRQQSIARDDPRMSHDFGAIARIWFGGKTVFAGKPSRKTSFLCGQKFSFLRRLGDQVDSATGTGLFPKWRIERRFCEARQFVLLRHADCKNPAMRQRIRCGEPTCRRQHAAESRRTPGKVCTRRSQPTEAYRCWS